MDIKAEYDKLKQLVNDMSEDVDAFVTKGNNSAAGRIRKAMQDAKGLAQGLRKGVQEKRTEAAAAKKAEKEAKG